MQGYSYGNFVLFNKMIKKQPISQEKEYLNKYQEHLKNFIKVIVEHQTGQAATDTIKSFITLFGETKCRINAELILQNLDLVKLVSCPQKRLYSISKQITKNSKQPVTYRAYTLYGKAITVYKRSKNSNNLSFQQQQIKNQAIQSIQSTMLRMWQDNRLPMIKSQPHQMQDLLLNHQLIDQTLEPIVVSHEIFSSWVPISQAIVIIVPDQNAKVEIMSMVRSSLLHVYMDDVLAINKICTKQNFYKNSQFKGIYYIQSGQVQVKSGRVVARGWVICGKCRNSGTGWRFKPLPFFKFVLGNQHIWKQFYNDISLNDELPFKVAHILSIDDQYEEELNGEQRKFKTKKRVNNIKFPPLGGNSRGVNAEKYFEIDKMRHYNGKMNFMFDCKQQILDRKIGRSLQLQKNKQAPIQSQPSQRQMAKKIQYLSKKASLDNRKMSKEISMKKNQSTQNVYVVSVLKKLKQLNKMNQVQSPRKQILQNKSSRSKIIGLKKYEQIKQNQKNHRHKGKNRYY